MPTAERALKTIFRRSATAKYSSRPGAVSPKHKLAVRLKSKTRSKMGESQGCMSEGIKNQAGIKLRAMSSL